jgi:hypothetical protein
MYRTTLRHAKDVSISDQEVFLPTAVADAVGLVSETVNGMADASELQQLEGALRDVIYCLPLDICDALERKLDQEITSPVLGQPEQTYQASKLLNGLIFCRLVRACEPRLADEAQELETEICSFLEPHYRCDREEKTAAQGDV